MGRIMEFLLALPIILGFGAIGLISGLLMVGAVKAAESGSRWLKRTIPTIPRRIQARFTTT
jgi:hypothetical protein